MNKIEKRCSSFKRFGGEKWTYIHPPTSILFWPKENNWACFQATSINKAWASTAKINKYQEDNVFSIITEYLHHNSRSAGDGCIMFVIYGQHMNICIITICRGFQRDSVDNIIVVCTGSDGHVHHKQLFSYHNWSNKIDCQTKTTYASDASEFKALRILLLSRLRLEIPQDT